MIKVVVVDDSSFMRTVISKILEEGGIDVVDTAKNGKKAIEEVKEHKPDAVTMDIEMPVMNGLEAVEEIMKTEPTPILMLSALTKKGAEISFDAIEKGAVDFMAKPGGDASIEISKVKDKLVNKVKEVAKADVYQKKELEKKEPQLPKKEYLKNSSLIIGASTGGPKCIELILNSLPKEAQLSILIIQHMSSPFTRHFAERLNKKSDYLIKQSDEGVVAKGGCHLKVTDYFNGKIGIKTYEGEAINNVKPSIDLTMRSAAAEITDPVVGVLLTGMGKDGVEGARALKKNGASILVQDKETSQVFGIPKKTLEAVDVDGVFPLGDLPKKIIDKVSVGG